MSEAESSAVRTSDHAGTCVAEASVATSPRHRCIVIQPGTVAPSYLDTDQDDDTGQWTNRPAATLAVLFFVTGAFGIPLLWRRPSFSLWQRIFWSLVVTLYTIALFVGVTILVLRTLDSANGG
ncbi:hypothetical protein LOC71_08565 [Rhodopirellula sp. JC740]|uniref:Transmembrane protein n=1 Tax=Rhodopirellula halodulae TaxID=2894198 RepID=A0ABS8NFK0_9BACT|nr:hypothetical protein [Rhodopirellula sp. JC740]MCC9642325.1 hypothetical protein [Rhodopirellula sp. JC740]